MNKNSPDCLICGSQSIPFIQCYAHEIDSKIKLFKCTKCKIIFVYPFPEETIFEKLCCLDYYSKPGNLKKFLQRLRKNKFSTMPPGNLLDVGCGTGSFLNAMAKSNWNSYGSDISSESKKYLKEKSNLHSNVKEIYFKTLSENKLNNSFFNLITYWHVLEHIKFPQAELKEVRRILKPEGRLFLVVPNIESISFRLFKCNWFYLDLPGHLFHFSVESLSKLLLASGFKVEKINYCSFEYNPFGVFQSIFNFLGFKFNFCYDLLRKRISVFSSPENFASFIFTLILVPIIAPLSLILAYVFSFLKKPDTFELTIKKSSA